MIRLQIQLTVDQHHSLKRWADSLGISFSEAVRRCVAEKIERDESKGGHSNRVREGQSVIGKYASGRSDISERHDDYLTDAFGE